MLTNFKKLRFSSLTHLAALVFTFAAGEVFAQSTVSDTSVQRRTFYHWKTDKTAKTVNMRFFEATAATGSEYVGFRAPYNVNASYTLIWPVATGSSGQVLTLVGTDSLGFTTVSGGGSLTIREVDLTPSIAAATILEFLQSTGIKFTDQGGNVGRVELDTSTVWINTKAEIATQISAAITQKQDDSDTTGFDASKTYVNSRGFLTAETGDISAVAAGTGLAGGGTTGAVTLNVDTASVFIQTKTENNSLYVIIGRMITAGNGLVGGGDLGSNRTLDIIGSDGLKADADTLRILPSSASGLQLVAGAGAIDSIQVKLNGSTLIKSIAGLKVNAVGSGEVTDNSLTAADIDETVAYNFSNTSNQFTGIKSVLDSLRFNNNGGIWANDDTLYFFRKSDGQFIFKLRLNDVPNTDEVLKIAAGRIASWQADATGGGGGSGNFRVRDDGSSISTTPKSLDFRNGLQAIAVAADSLEVFNIGADGIKADTDSLRILFAATAGIRAKPGSTAAADSVELKIDGATLSKSTAGVKVPTDGITATEIATDAIGALELATNAVDSSNVIDGSLINTDVRVATLDSTRFKQLGISAGDINTGAILNGKLAASAVDSNKIAAGQVTTTDIKDLNVNTGDIAAQAVTGAKMALATLDSTHIVNGGIAATDLANGLILNTKIAASAIDSSKVIDGGLSSNDLRTRAVTAVKIALAVIDSTHITNSAVAATDLANASVLNAKIAASAVDSTKIKDSNVTSLDIKDANVNASDLASGSVTNAKIAAGAVDSSKVTDGSIAATDLVNLSVLNGKIAASAVDSTKIKTGNVTTTDILDLGINTGDLANDAVTAAKIVADAVGASELDETVAFNLSSASNVLRALAARLDTLRLQGPSVIRSAKDTLIVRSNTGGVTQRFYTGGSPADNQILKFVAGSKRWRFADDSTAAGGSGTPGGSTTQIQFNDAGAFGGDADNTWDKTNNIQNVTGRYRNTAITEPAAAASTTLDTYGKTVAGNVIPFYRSANDKSWMVDDEPLKYQQVFTVKAASALNFSGSGATYSGTLTHVVGTEVLGGYMANFATAATTASVAGFTSINSFYRGSTAGANGFTFFTRVLFPDATYASLIFFFGLSNSTPAAVVTSNNPTGHHCGFQYEVTRDGTTIKFATKDGTTQSTATTAMAFAVNKIYDMWLYCPSQGTTIYWQIDNRTDNTTQSGSVTANLPGASTAMGPIAAINNNSAVARNWRLRKLWVKSDL